MADFKDRLIQLRKERDISQEQLAADLGLSKGTIGNYETGTREPKDIKLLEHIADYFNVDIDYLVGRSVDVPEYSLEEKWLIMCYRKADQPVKDGIRSILWSYDEKNNPHSRSVSA